MMAELLMNEESQRLLNLKIETGIEERHDTPEHPKWEVDQSCGTEADWVAPLASPVGSDAVNQNNYDEIVERIRNSVNSSNLEGINLADSMISFDC